MSGLLKFNEWKLIREFEDLGDPPVDSIHLVELGRLLKPGRRGEAVKLVQNWLGVRNESGEYDEETERAVRKFQSENELDPDGIVGKLTIAKLKNTYDPNSLSSDDNYKPDPSFKPDPIPTSDNLGFPIILSGSYTVADSVPHRGDALHAFDRRRSDKFGGRMLRGWEDDTMKSKWGHLVKLDQGIGINQKLQDLISMGIKPDVEDIRITTVGNTVKWTAKIVQSRDGKAWAGVQTRGSAGGGKQNALNQVEELKKNNPEFKNWKVVHEIDKPGLNQFFLKYTA